MGPSVVRSVGSPQEPPKTGQELSKSRPRRPGAPRRLAKEVQDSPRACQEPTKMPRSSPGHAQDLPRISQNRLRHHTHYPRLEKKSQLHHAKLQDFFPSHKAAEIKNERRRYSPQGGLQSAAQRERRVRWGYEVFLSFRILLLDSSSQRFLSSPS